MMVDIATSKPIDKRSAVIISDGENYNHFQYIKGKKITSSIPIPFSRPNKNKICVNFTDEKIGKLVVLGIYRGHDFKLKKYWVVKCVCGKYELRTADELKKADNRDACQQCKYNDGIRKRLSNDSRKVIEDKSFEVKIKKHSTRRVKLAKKYSLSDYESDKYIIFEFNKVPYELFEKEWIKVNENIDKVENPIDALNKRIDEQAEMIENLEDTIRTILNKLN